MSQADSLRHIADLYDELEKEKDEMRARWESACGTVAAMHAAAVGEVCGPRRGVVEDVADLRAEVSRLQDGCSRMHAEVEQLCAVIRDLLPHAPSRLGVPAGSRLGIVWDRARALAQPAATGEGEK